MDALPFIIERLSEPPLNDFLSKNSPHYLDNLDFVIKELIKVERYMRWSDFMKQSEDQKQALIKGLRLTVIKVGKFMSDVHEQYAPNRFLNQEHDAHKAIDEMVKEWGEILNIIAGIVYFCYVLKSNQAEMEFALEEVYGENFEELERINNISVLLDNPNMRLKEQESLQLFLLKAFPVLTENSEPSKKKIFLLEFSKELDNLPQLICKACHGLPLALVLVGSLLSLKEKINDIWNGVKEDLYKFNNQDNRLLNIINYCYEDLPYFLKPCFLYLACYPKGYKIPLRALINIWIAEGFIPTEREEETVEEKAFKYLKQLVRRSLVDVSERSLLGSIKYCCVNPVVHQFAIEQSNKEGFFVANPDGRTIESLFRVAIHRDNNCDAVPSELVDTRGFPNLETMKSIRLEGKWSCWNLYIDNIKFPPNLTKLTMNKSALKEDPMPRLGKLKYLKFLCLQDGAYTGKQMTCSARGFPQLQYLELSNLENLEKWMVEAMALSELKTLRVIECDKLKTLPNLEHVTQEGS